MRQWIWRGTIAERWTLPTRPNRQSPLVERLRTGRCVLCAGSPDSVRQMAMTAASARARRASSIGRRCRPGGRRRDAQRARIATARRCRLRAPPSGRSLRRRARRRRPPRRSPNCPRRCAYSASCRSAPSSPRRTTTRSSAPSRATASCRASTRPATATALKNDGKARFIFKALGDPTRAETIVWSAEDLQAALADGGYRSVAHDLYRSRSFLFVGFEGQDPDLGILLERVLSGVRSSDVEHYAILPGLGAVEKEELYAAYHIRVLDVGRTWPSWRARSRTPSATRSAPALPDDDDFEGWLALLAEDAGARRRARQARRARPRAARARRLGEAGRAACSAASASSRPAERRAACCSRYMARASSSARSAICRKAFTALVAALQGASAGDAAWTSWSGWRQATGMWNELLSELAEVVPTLPDGERAQTWLRLARLYGDKLNAAEYALTALDEALKLDARRSTTRPSCASQLLRRLERWSELAAALAGDAGRLRRAGRGARVAARRRRGAAAAAYRAALDERAASSTRRARRSSSCCASTTSGASWPRCSTSGRRSSPSPDEARALRLEAALVRRRASTIASRPSCATRRWPPTSRAISTVLRALERLYQADGQEKEYIECLGRQADVAERSRARSAMYRRMASLWEEHPGGAGARRGVPGEAALRRQQVRGRLPLARAALSRRPQVGGAHRRAPSPRGAGAGTDRGRAARADRCDLRARAAPARRAIEAFLDVETALPNHGETLEALTRLYEKTGAVAEGGRCARAARPARRHQDAEARAASSRRRDLRRASSATRARPRRAS